VQPRPTPAGDRVGHPVERRGVVPEELAAQLGRLAAERGVDLLAHVAVEADRVRAVGLEQDVGRPDLVDEALGRGLLEEPAAVHLAVEVLARQQLELRPLDPHRGLAERVVGGLEEERDEPDAGLRRDAPQRVPRGVSQQG